MADPVNMFADAAAWASDQRQNFGSSPIVYRRGGADLEIQGTPSRFMFQVDSGNGLVISMEARDFKIRAADLVFDGLTTPEPGDRIMFNEVVYEVCELAGEPPWSWADSYGIDMKIHTKAAE